MAILTRHNIAIAIIPDLKIPTQIPKFLNPKILPQPSNPPQTKTQSSQSPNQPLPKSSINYQKYINGHIRNHRNSKFRKRNSSAVLTFNPRIQNIQPRRRELGRNHSKYELIRK